MPGITRSTPTVACSVAWPGVSTSGGPASRSTRPARRRARQSPRAPPAPSPRSRPDGPGRSPSSGTASTPTVWSAHRSPPETRRAGTGRPARTARRRGPDRSTRRRRIQGEHHEPQRAPGTCACARIVIRSSARVAGAPLSSRPSGLRASSCFDHQLRVRHVAAAMNAHVENTRWTPTSVRPDCCAASRSAS